MANRIGTLTANTAAAVDIADTERVEVMNRDGSAEIWVRLGTTNPTVAGTDPHIFCLPAVKGAARVFHVDIPAGEDKEVTVRLISSGTPTYCVQPL